jgi:RNA polymerase sigma-70 factor (ECF subfamily)
MLSFQDLYTAYAPDVYRFAYWLAGSSVEAEDITSETFIRAWIRFDTIQTETLKAYLLTIARNLYLEWRRKERFQADLEDIHPDTRPGPEQLAEDQTVLETALTILRTLPENDRAAFILRIQHDLPYAEIARILQLSESAVKVKVYRTRKKLLAASIFKERV